MIWGYMISLVKLGRVVVTEGTIFVANAGVVYPHIMVSREEKSWN